MPERSTQQYMGPAVPATVQVWCILPLEIILHFFFFKKIFVSLFFLFQAALDSALKEEEDLELNESTEDFLAGLASSSSSLHHPHTHTHTHTHTHLLTTFLASPISERFVGQKRQKRRQLLRPPQKSRLGENYLGCDLGEQRRGNCAGIFQATFTFKETVTWSEAEQIDVFLLLLLLFFETREEKEMCARRTQSNSILLSCGTWQICWHFIFLIC